MPSLADLLTAALNKADVSNSANVLDGFQSVTATTGATTLVTVLWRYV